MKKYNYEMRIAGPASPEGEAEADSKMQSLTVLGARLSSKELKRLEQVVLHEPMKLAIAKKALGV
jgi:hypothetical protein